MGDRVGLPIARAKTPNLPAKEAGTPVLGSPYPTTKASCQVLPGGLEKKPHILGTFFLDILLPLLYFRLSLKQVLIIGSNRWGIPVTISLPPSGKNFGTTNTIMPMRLRSR